VVLAGVGDSEGKETWLDYTGRDADDGNSCGVFFTSGL
jgi:hypothetical protein